MAKISAGLLLYRRRGGAPEVFLVHPGGPFWAKKDAGAWSIAKGEAGTGEALLAAARREFQEETGLRVSGDFRALDPVRQPSGKLVHGWAIEADCDAAAIRSNTFEMEWPPHSGVVQAFPEIDRVEWFELDEARRRLKAAQVPFLDRLQAALAV